ncbi:hypothetical protein BDZ89DRAFT_1143365 [Hymenopellis radicata]|nr:hypothetical protein BDZ89DRAFT_1143365 [Hymenopellis radicata]
MSIKAFFPKPFVPFSYPPFLRLLFRPPPPFKGTSLTDLHLTYRLTSANHNFIALSLPITDILPKRLTSLHIACDVSNFIDADLDVLASWLHLATDVTAFSLHLPNIPVTLIYDLLVHPEGDVQLPRLRSLDLSVISNSTKDAQMPTAMVLDVLESHSDRGGLTFHV